MSLSTYFHKSTLDGTHPDSEVHILVVTVYHELQIKIWTGGTHAILLHAYKFEVVQ